jgi:hypothetical protein
MKLKQYRQRRKLDLWKRAAVEELHCSDGGYWALVIVLCAKLPMATILRRRPSW